MIKLISDTAQAQVEVEDKLINVGKMLGVGANPNLKLKLDKVKTSPVWAQLERSLSLRYGWGSRAWRKLAKLGSARLIYTVTHLMRYL